MVVFYLHEKLKNLKFLIFKSLVSSLSILFILFIIVKAKEQMLFRKYIH
jgi:hypothetical protein